METKKENPIKPSGSLLIKIFAGYTILALLVIGIIAALWHEKNGFCGSRSGRERNACTTGTDQQDIQSACFTLSGQRIGISA